jgi:uncharacterized membrane protein
MLFIGTLRKTIRGGKKMTVISFTNLVLIFAIYSITGWACEVICCSVKAKKLAWRGFLAGPYCPVYGFGALVLILLAQRLADKIAGLPLLFIAGAVTASTLVYFTSRFTEKLFSGQWRDHARGRVHNGRLGLPHSVLFGVVGIVMLYAVQPFVWALIQRIPSSIRTSTASFFVAAILMDLVTTMNSVYRFDVKLKNLQTVSWTVKSPDNNRICYNKRGLIRRPDKRTGETDQREAGTKAVPQKSAAAAAGLNFYKLFWIFFIGCVVGYVVESLYCLITEGHIESRQGLIYGPFSQIYGLGAVLMVLVLSRLAHKSDCWVFVGSAVIGGALETVCSLIQEGVFGSVSWDYEEKRFALFGGRTSLLFILFWGVLGVIFIREIFPPLSRFVERIQSGGRGLVLSWVLIVFMALNMGVSALAVHRWSERLDGIPPRNAVEVFLNERYPDSFLETIYPNIHFKNAGAA